jgi:transposase
MKDADESLPSDLAAAHAMILAERAARLEAEAIAARAQAANSTTEAMIAHLKLEIEKLRRELYGSSSERKARLLAQMELQSEDLEPATEDELAAEKAAVGTQTVRSFQRRRSSRKPFPDHLARERVVMAEPDSCPCCGSAKLSKLGEDVTETLEVIPRQWKVIQTVREKFSSRQCEAITQPPVPFHVTPRGFGGPNLLAMILFEKFGQHQPLNRQSERYRREGIDLSVSTLVTRLAPERSSCNSCARRDLARKVHGTSALSVGDRAHMRFSHRREMLMSVDACSETGIRWNYGFVFSRVGFSHLDRQRRI